jgi:hypothetical protein
MNIDRDYSYIHAANIIHKKYVFVCKYATRMEHTPKAEHTHIVTSWVWTQKKKRDKHTSNTYCCYLSIAVLSRYTRKIHQQKEVSSNNEVVSTFLCNTLAENYFSFSYFRLDNPSIYSTVKLWEESHNNHQSIFILLRCCSKKACISFSSLLLRFKKKQQ